MRSETYSAGKRRADADAVTAAVVRIKIKRNKSSGVLYYKHTCFIIRLYCYPKGYRQMICLLLRFRSVETRLSPNCHL